MRYGFVVFIGILLLLPLGNAGFSDTLRDGWEFIITGNAVADTSILQEDTPAEITPSTIEPTPVEQTTTAPTETTKPVPQPPATQPIPSEEQQGIPTVGHGCGDGRCDRDQGEDGSWCPQDCGNEGPKEEFKGQEFRNEQFQNQQFPQPIQDRIEKRYGPSANDQQQKYGSNWCPNGRCCPDKICDDYEQQSGGCPLDCQQGVGEQFKENLPQFQGECTKQEDLEQKKAECNKQGGVYNSIYEPNSGCSHAECSFSQQGGGMFGDESCPTEEDVKKQSQKCGDIGDRAIIIPSRPGCAPRVTCVPENAQAYGYGLDQQEYEQSRERFDNGEISPSTVLDLILKLDSLEIKFDSLGGKLSGIAQFYEKKGDQERSERYQNAQEILGTAGEKISSIREELKSAVESGDIGWDSISKIKTDLKYTSDTLLNQIIGILLGVDVPVATEEVVENLGCGSNPMCFEQYFRTCQEGASFTPEQMVTVSIDGTNDEGSCKLQIEGPMGFGGICTIPDYQYFTLSKETIKPYCDENLQQMMVDRGPPSGVSQRPPQEFQQQIDEENSLDSTSDGGELGGNIIEEPVQEDLGATTPEEPDTTIEVVA